MNPIVTVGALIARPDGAVLLVQTHKWRGLYGIPGGKIDAGEALEEALVREIREETGLSVSDLRFALVQESIDSPEFHRPGHYVLVNYFCRADEAEVRLNEEAQAHCWVSPEEALRLPMNVFTRRLVEAFLGLRQAP